MILHEERVQDAHDVFLFRLLALANTVVRIVQMANCSFAFNVPE